MYLDANNIYGWAMKQLSSRELTGRVYTAPGSAAAAAATPGRLQQQPLDGL